MRLDYDSDQLGTFKKEKVVVRTEQFMFSASVLIERKQLARIL